MRISSFRVAHMLGITELEFKPGKITEITGRNGSGKSSALAALQVALKGGSLMGLAQVGAKKDPEVVLVLDDGSARVAREGKKTLVEERVGNTAAMEEKKRPQQWLDSLYDAQSSNPMTFLSAHPNERAEILLKILPLELLSDQVREAVGDEVWPLVSAVAQAGGHPLTVLSGAHDAIFAARTGINTTRRDKAASADQLRRSIPADMPLDEDASALTKLEAERDALAGAVAKAKADAESSYRGSVTEAQAAHDAVEADAKGSFKAAAARARSANEGVIRALEQEAEAKVAELMRQIAAIKEELAKTSALHRETTQAEVDRLNDEAVARIDASAAVLEQARASAEEARRRALAEVAADEKRVAGMVETIARQREQRDRITELRKTRELAERFEGEVASLDGKAEAYSAGIEALRGLRDRLLAALPFNGLEVKGKTITLNGVDFEQVNTAARIRFAVQVAALRAKTRALPVLFIDGAEALDEEQYHVLVDELKKTGTQVFISRVTSGDLSVRAIA